VANRSNDLGWPKSQAEDHRHLTGAVALLLVRRVPGASTCNDLRNSTTLERIHAQLNWAALPRRDPPKLTEAVGQLAVRPIDQWGVSGEHRENLHYSRCCIGLDMQKGIHLIRNKEEARYGTELSLSRSALTALRGRESYAATP
jgi:hypothetical protein